MSYTTHSFIPIEKEGYVIDTGSLSGSAADGDAYLNDNDCFLVIWNASTASVSASCSPKTQTKINAGIFGNQTISALTRLIDGSAEQDYAIWPIPTGYNSGGYAYIDWEDNENVSASMFKLVDKR